MRDRRLLLKVKIKSLQAEAKIIKREERKQKGQDIAGVLLSHRIHSIRPEQRATLLAYGFIRGRPYKKVECCAHKDPNWDKVKRMINQYSNLFISDETLKNWYKQQELVVS